MGGGAGTGPQIYDAALHRRKALMGASGPAALVKNLKVFSIAAFACIGGVLYGYNQGMFSGVLAMPSFQSRESDPQSHRPNHTSALVLTQFADMGEYAPMDPNADQTKKGWLTSILELGAWVGTLLSGFLAEAISRKFSILVATLVFMLGVVIQATAGHVGYQAILAGRFITYAHALFFRPAIYRTLADVTIVAWASAVCPWLSPSTTPNALLQRCEERW